MNRFILPMTIGIGGAAIAIAVLLWGGAVVAKAQVATSDWLLVRADGPRLGARPARRDLALVSFDYATGQQLGYVHSYSNDVVLYRKLIKAGASVVFDTRMIAAATPEAFADIKPMLEEMLVISNDGRLMRDVWLSSDLLTASAGRYDRLLTQNVINSHPHALPDITSRFYPLAYFSSAGPSESAPLCICRKVWGHQQATSATVGDELRRSGIMSVWHQYSPQLVPKTEVPKSPYQIGEHKFVWYPFLSTTSLVPPAAFWVSYDPPISDYERHSYLDVFNATDSIDLTGKIVLVGFSADIDPTSETYSVPNLIGKASAAEVVACATQTLLDDRNMRVIPKPIAWPFTALFCLVMALITGLAKPIQAAIFSTLLLLFYFAVAVSVYRSGWYSDCLVAPACSVATGVTAGIVNAWLSLRTRHRIVELFGRYVPRAVVNQLLQRPDLEQLKMGGVKRDVTVMFADIRGFTDFSQDLPPEDVVRELNSLLEVMVNCTFENEGTLDKFIGDAILVLFNAPLDQPDHVDRAVQTAITIQQRLDGHKSGLRVGIGVHRGDAVVGNVGSPQRLEYTAIGSTVNIASRLCGTAQPGEVIISNAVLASLSNRFEVVPMDAVQVKGIKESINVARVIGFK